MMLHFSDESEIDPSTKLKATEIPRVWRTYNNNNGVFAYAAGIFRIQTVCRARQKRIM